MLLVKFGEVSVFLNACEVRSNYAKESERFSCKLSYPLAEMRANELCLRFAGG